MTPGIGAPGSSRIRSNPIDKSTRGQELDKIEVTAPRRGSVSSQQHAADSQRSPSPAQNLNPKQFVMPGKLKNEAAAFVKSLGKQQSMTGAQLLQRMTLEGKLIAEHQDHALKTDKTGGAALSYAELSEKLGIDDPLPRQIDDINAKLDTDLKALKGSSSSDREQLDKMTALFTTSLRTQTELFAHRGAQYEEVRNMSADKLSGKDREHALLSEMNFSIFATHSACAIPSLITTSLTKAEKTAAELRKDPKNEVEAKAWEATAAQLKSVQKDVLPDFKNAIDQAKLSHLIDQYQKSGSSSKNQMLTFLLQGLRQLGLSGFALGAARAFTMAGLSEHPVAKVIVAGLATAFAHDLGTHLLASAIVAVFGGETVPVDTLQVVPAANRLVSENGVVRPRTDDELKTANDALKPYRADHTLSKNANKVGTGSGEVKAWLMFLAFQGLRAGVTSLMDLTKFQEAGAITLASMAAGMMMGGIHGSDGMNAKVEDPEGRKLPANVPKPPDGSTVEARLAKAGKEGLQKLNMLKDANLSMLANKSAGLIAGIGISDSVGTKILSATAAATENRPELKAGIATLVGGLQSVLMLSTAWSSFALDAQVKADIGVRDAERIKNDPELAAAKAAGTFKGSEPKNWDRIRTAGLNVLHPGRAEGSHATNPETEPVGRFVENLYLGAQGVVTVPTAGVTDLGRVGVNYLADKVRGKDGKSDKTPGVATRPPAGGVTDPSASTAASSSAPAVSSRKAGKAPDRGADAGGESSQGKK